MPIVYVTTGAWGTGSGTPNSAAQVDGNFYDVDQRIVDLGVDLAEGKRIDTVTYTSTSMTFHFTDGTSQTIPLPVVTLEYIGPWMNSTPYHRGQMITGQNGFYQILEDHTTPPPPAAFDPNATDGSTDNNRLYQLWMPLSDINYDAAIFVPGSIQRDPDELLFQGIANRTMNLGTGDEGAYAYLDVGNDSTGATDVVISIEKNGTEIGIITFDAAGDIDSDGGQVGAFTINTAVDFAEGDRYALRVTQSDNVEPAGLSVTLPFVRTDIV
jgi:hypothetical protein